MRVSLEPSSVEVVSRLCNTVTRLKQRDAEADAVRWAEKVRDEEVNKLRQRILATATLILNLEAE
jgi:hypothetical protein